MMEPVGRNAKLWTVWLLENRTVRRFSADP